MTNKNKNILLVGAAVAAGIAGTLATFFWPEKDRDLTEKAKKTANNMLDSFKNMNREEAVVTQDFFIGGVAGSLIAATAALLLAPKAGKDLLSDINHFFRKAPKLEKHIQKHKKAAVNGTKKVVRHVAAAKRVVSKSVAEAPKKLKQAVKKKPCAVKHKAHKSTSR